MTYPCRLYAATALVVFLYWETAEGSSFRNVAFGLRGGSESFADPTNSELGAELRRGSILDVEGYGGDNGKSPSEERLRGVVNQFDLDDVDPIADIDPTLSYEDLDSVTVPAGSKDALYNAYNELHNVAQEFNKGFDAPAVVVVGHQSSGKSALIEALMGFQFNQVGGGTKTRRPIALRMQYKPDCHVPKCFLVGEDGIERPMSLTQIQEYIKKENLRLERDPMKSFDPREINVRMEYKYCPNMILIDTPGLIAAPRIPKASRGGAGSAFAHQRALQQSAREAERLVIDKMRCQDYLILCVEDTADWKHGATREVVQKADPDLSRTVIVNTKFDTKVPQFGTSADLEAFLGANIIDRISPYKLGGPFFTSVPSGRVGREVLDQETGDFSYLSDDEFVAACSDSESSDQSLVKARLARLNNAGQAASSALSDRVGLSKLRKFLEQRVYDSYRRNVAKIIPMLQAETVACERKLVACEKELDLLSVDRLKAGAESFCDEFSNCLRKSLQGNIVAPASLFGETLAQENSEAGSFRDVRNCPMSVSDRTWDRLVATDVGHHEHRLYGGSQYHRTLREFNLATKCLRLPTISEDEIANAAGIGTTHDGVNFLHAACVIALEKARISFEPLLKALGVRVTHVMEKLFPVSEYILKENAEREKALTGLSSKFMFEFADESVNKATDITQNPQFTQLVRRIFERFIRKCSLSAMSKCRDDLVSITRYVTWNLDERSSGALKRSLPDQTDLVSIYQVALKSTKKATIRDEEVAPESEKKGGALTKAPRALTPIDDDRDYYNLLQLLEEAMCARDANRTNLVVGGLVQHIVAQWRDQFARTVTTKFNCYFMLPFADDFQKFMRKELQEVYEGTGDLYDVFDLNSAREALEQRRLDLEHECSANKRLQEKFESLDRSMRSEQEKQQQ